MELPTLSENVSLGGLGYCLGCCVCVQDRRVQTVKPEYSAILGAISCLEHFHDSVLLCHALHSVCSRSYDGSHSFFSIVSIGRPENALDISA